jgi:hypothetical protein
MMKLALADLAALMRIVQVIFAVITFAVGLVSADDVAVYIHRPVAAEAGGGGGIEFDAASSDSTSDTSLTFSHTTSGSNRAIGVCVGWRVNDGQSISGVTYNGVALTEDANSPVLDGRTATALYSLVNPASGANNIVVSLSGAATSIASIAVSFTGAHQTTLTGTSATDTLDNGTSDSLDVSSASGEIVFDCLAHYASGEAATPGGSQTERGDLGDGDLSLAASTQPGATTTSMSWSWATDTYWGHIGVGLKPAP